MGDVDIYIEREGEQYTCDVNVPVEEVVASIRDTYSLMGGKIDQQQRNGKWRAMRSGQIITGDTQYRFNGGKPLSQQTGG